MYLGVMIVYAMIKVDRIIVLLIILGQGSMNSQCGKKTTMLQEGWGASGQFIIRIMIYHKTT